MNSSLSALIKIFLIYGLTIVLLARAGGATSRTRRDYESENYPKCTCPKGHFVSQPCIPTHRAVCRSCPDGTFSTARGYQRSCESCSTACPRGDDEVQVKNCTAAKDIRCQCKKGTYLRSRSDNYCTEHKRCRQGHGVKRKGNHVRNTRCERCRVGMYSPMTSATAKCRKWTDCKAKNRQIKRRGNRRRNNVCGDVKTKPSLNSEFTASTAETETITTATDNDIQEMTSPQPMCPLDGDKESDNGTLQCPVHVGPEGASDNINVVGPGEEGDMQIVTPTGGGSNTDGRHRKPYISTPIPTDIFSAKFTPTRREYWFTPTKPAKSSRTNRDRGVEQNVSQVTESPGITAGEEIGVPQDGGAESETQITSTASRTLSGESTTIESPPDLSTTPLQSPSTKILITNMMEAAHAYAQNDTLMEGNLELNSSSVTLNGTRADNRKENHDRTTTKKTKSLVTQDVRNEDETSISPTEKTNYESPTPRPGEEMGLRDILIVISVICIIILMIIFAAVVVYICIQMKEKRQRYEEDLKKPLLQRNHDLQRALDQIEDRLVYDEVVKLMRILLESVGIDDAIRNNVMLDDLKNNVGPQAPARDLLHKGIELWEKHGGSSVSVLMDALKDIRRNDLVHLLQDLLIPESNDEVSLSTISTTEV